MNGSGFSKLRKALGLHNVAKNPLSAEENARTAKKVLKETSAVPDLIQKPDFGQTIIRIPKEDGDELNDGNLSFAIDTDDCEINETVFMIRLADTPQGRNAASLLINKMYRWRGYEGSHQISDCPDRITLTASDKKKVVGTATLGLDSPMGLLADTVFKDEIDKCRRNGARVCEITKLAFDPETRSKAVIASLFHIIFIYGRRLHRCTDVFIEVNPRNRVFYERMLGFQVRCETHTNPRVNAPAVLLWADIGFIEQQIKTYGGRTDLIKTTRSLYPYFFSVKEEDGIFGRLRLLDQH